MKETTITSIYGKTLEFKPYSSGAQRQGTVEVTYRDDEGCFKGGMLFKKEQMDALRVALAEPATPVAKSDAGVFFLLRQKKEKTKTVKVCFAESTTSREFTSRARAEAAAKRQNENYPEWNYFVVEKETV